MTPCAEIVKLPVAAFAATPKTTETLAPAAMLNGLAGFDVTPAGRALSVTCTLPVKPLMGVTEKLTAELAAPCCTVIEPDDRPRVKSGIGGGGGVTDDEPPPQPAHFNVSNSRISFGTQ